jgi:hypothetical protein
VEKIDPEFRESNIRSIYYRVILPPLTHLFFCYYSRRLQVCERNVDDEETFQVPPNDDDGHFTFHRRFLYRSKILQF